MAPLLISKILLKINTIYQFYESLNFGFGTRLNPTRLLARD